MPVTREIIIIIIIIIIMIMIIIRKELETSGIQDVRSKH